MAWHWVCECGEEFVANSPNTGKRKASAHVKETKETGSPHKIAGLMDTETGELIVEGLDFFRANEMWQAHKDTMAEAAMETGDSKSGDVTEPEDPPPESAPSAPEPRSRPDPTPATPMMGRRVPEKPRTTGGGKAGGTIDPQKPKNQMSNMMVTLTGWHMLLGPDMFPLFSLGTQVVTREDGRVYEFTPEGISDYLNDVIRDWHRERMPVLLGVAYGLDPEAKETQRASQRMWERIERMTQDQANVLWEQTLAELQGQGGRGGRQWMDA